MFCRSQWPRGLRNELSSPAQTLLSWFRIPFKAWMSVSVYSTFVLSFVQVTALRRADPPSKGSFRLCKRSRKWKTGQGSTKSRRAIDRYKDAYVLWSYQLHVPISISWLVEAMKPESSRLFSHNRYVAILHYMKKKKPLWKLCRLLRLLSHIIPRLQILYCRVRLHCKNSRVLNIAINYRNSKSMSTRSKSLWRWYISTNIMFLDIIHRHVFI
jgi:hypothetical protein